MNAVPTYWFIVANSTRARVIAITGRQGQPTEIAAWVHPESRLHEQELTSDLPGRSFDSHGQGRHAAFVLGDFLQGGKECEDWCFCSNIGPNVFHGIDVTFDCELEKQPWVIPSGFD